MEAEKSGGFWHQVSKAFDYPSPAAIIPYFYRAVNLRMWKWGDEMMVQRIKELEWKSGLRPALTREAAIKRARQHIPDYVVPPKVAGSRLLSRVLQDMMLTLFGRYRYSQWKTWFHDTHETIGPTKSKEERGAAIGRLLAAYVAYTFLYPMLDEYLQKLLGIPDAKIVRGGPFHIVENAERLQKEGASGLPRFLFTTFIPSAGDDDRDPDADEPRDVEGSVRLPRAADHRAEGHASPGHPPRGRGRWRRARHRFEHPPDFAGKPGAGHRPTVRRENPVPQAGSVSCVLSW